jgi:hypothetical protein
MNDCPLSVIVMQAMALDKGKQEVFSEVRNNVKKIA